MILAIDVGNTNVVLGCIEQGEIKFEARIATDHNKTADQYAIDIQDILGLYNVLISNIEGAIVSCVVPPLTNAIKKAIELLTGETPLVVGPGVKTGLNIMTDNPAQLGSDLVVGAVAALAQYPTPMVIFDLGTATTASVIDVNKTFLGGMIYPGINVSLSALTQSTSQLPRISIEKPSKVIGKNTIDCMNSGIVYGNASMIDGITDRVEQELGSDVTVVATGGLSGLIAPYCRRQVIHDASLMIKGLYLIYIKNAKAR